MLFCAFTVFAGAIVSSIGAYHESFSPVLGGRLLMGFGSTIIKIIPQKIYWHWFRGRVHCFSFLPLSSKLKCVFQGLAFVLGLDISGGKVIVLIAKATAIPMSRVGSTWSWALWVRRAVVEFRVRADVVEMT
jgi:hypothetical protein